MSKQEAQLKEDYGAAAVGNIAGIPVVVPEGGLEDGKAYNLVYSSDNGNFALTAAE